MNETELRNAVEIQQRTYLLLNWLNSAIERGFVSVGSVRKHVSDSTIAAEWINEHYLNLPDECRPASRNPNDIDPYANMFCSYLLASFDIQEQPGERYVPHDRRNPHARSPFVTNPHLRPKKLTTEDKTRARKLKILYVRQLALSCGSQINDERAKAIVEDSGLKEAVSMATYGEQLIRRTKGHVEGSAILALWREFARTSSGSPKQNFKLNAEHVLKCEETIASKVCGQQIGLS